MIRSFYFALIIFHSFASFASGIHINTSKEECRSVDIRDKNPHLRNFFSKPRNQATVGWCFAFAAADLFSVELGKPVSSLHIGSISNEYSSRKENHNQLRSSDGSSPSEDEFYKKILEGGTGFTSIPSVIANKKVCLESDLPYDKLYTGQTGHFFQELESLKQLLNDDPDLSSLTKAQKCSELPETFKNIFDKNFTFLEVYKFLQEENLNKALSEMVDRVCSERLVEIPKGLSLAWSFRPRLQNFVAQHFNKLNTSLENGKPVIIGYHTSHIVKPGPSGPHASVIVAREWRNGSCHYKIRNSWGPGCQNYRSDIDCIANEGSFWVSDQSVLKMANVLEFIKTN